MTPIKSSILRLSALILLTTSLSGCIGAMVAQSRTTDWGASGGSRADGFIQLSYDRSPLDKEKPVDSRVKQLAVTRCSVWGYQDAEPFDYVKTSCVEPGHGIFTCDLYRHSVQFQCTKPSNIQSGNTQSSSTVISPISN
ncbi:MULTISPECIES: YecR family lipoprotein [Eikenella]|uniref:YecR family lipoprotein n=1 Tax=Eikenella TaxID=538 RepID=UPI0009ED42C4|nr:MULTISPECIES: YecR family lipoprotein [Eikenella]VDH00639.1 Uncharacterised protein [Helicobacter pametensis]